MPGACRPGPARAPPLPGRSRPPISCAGSGPRRRLCYPELCRNHFRRSVLRRKIARSTRTEARMRLRGFLMTGFLLAAPFGALPAAAQPAPGLSYSQALNTPAVMQVQDRMRQAGLYSGRVDGVWGPDSQQALERFQQRNGLQVTGTLNQATAATLGLSPGDLLAAGAGPASNAGADAAAGPLSRAAVRNLQSRLRNLGFYR